LLKIRLYRTLCLKNKNWFLTTDDYTSLYLQYTYIAPIIYKCTHKKENTLSQRRGRFVARVCGGDKNPDENLSIKKNWSALQSAPYKSAKIKGFLVLIS
jgi:hypothetical protein